GSAMTGCSNDNKDPSLPTVKIGLHSNLGAGAGYSAYYQNFFKDAGVNVEFEVGAGPALATKVVAGDLNVSFMGGGVAWNYFTTNQEIKIAALDNLTDDDRLIASLTGKGKDLTTSSSLNEIGNVLKGSTVALDFTTNPFTWFTTSLLPAINETFEDGDKIWYTDLEGKNLPEGLTSYDAEDKVNLENVLNSNLTQTMEGAKYDFAVSFAPVATALEKQTSKFKTVARTSTHLSDAYQPSTWAVNTKWLNENEDTFKKFMVGLVKGMNYRHNNPEKTCEDIEKGTAGAVSASSLNTDIAIWLNAEQQLELYNNGKMMQYTENIRQGKLSNEKVDKNITAEKASVFKYLIDACNTVLGK
ncbi:MAG TPA: hypothetical protein DD621_02280, partial [Clostridiales bacterium]|nr:hypothetical protein [Clostridiales bacterium]